MAQRRVRNPHGNDVLRHAEQPVAERLRRDVDGRTRRRLYRATPALYQRDFTPDGFEWIDCNDNESSVLSFLRKGASLSQAYYQALLFTGRVVVLTGVTLGLAVATWSFSPITA